MSMAPGTEQFSDFRNFHGDMTEYVVHDLDPGYRVQIPAPDERRWSPDYIYGLHLQSIHLLNTGRGEVTASLKRNALHVDQTTVKWELWRQGVATRLMMRLFAVAKQHGAETSTGTAFNRKAIGMYVKMVGAENVHVIETSASESSVDAVMTELPLQHINDDHFCSYRIRLDDVRPEYIVEVPDTTR